jgi:acetyl esterase/lipase
MIYKLLIPAAAAFVVLTLIMATATAQEPKPAAQKKVPIPVPPGVSLDTAVTYRTFANGKSLQADIAYPAKGKGPFPAVVCVHGGGWTSGSRENLRPILLQLAEKGFVAIAPSYRLAPADPFPAQIHDVKCAVRWLRAHAWRYKVDTNRVGALGYSAGGHLACLLGMAGGVEHLEGDGPHANQTSAVQAVVSCYGVSDLTEWYQRGGFLARYTLSNVLKGEPAKLPNRYLLASPVTYANPTNSPTLLIHGSADTIVPLGQSVRLADKMREAGVDCELFVYAGAEHAFGSGCGGEHGRRCDRNVIEYFGRQLQTRAVATTGGRLSVRTGDR